MSSVVVGGSEDTLLVTFSNYGIPSVWQTYDGGENWSDISGNLPDMPIRWAIYHPQNTQKVMLATEIGIWSTKQAGSIFVIWEHDAILPNVRVDMLQSRKSDNHILAATHGRGLFLSTGATKVNSSPLNSPEGKLLIFPNPASDYISLQLGLESGNQLRIMIYNASGKLIREEHLSEGDIQISLDGMAAGSYVLWAKAGSKYYSQTFIKKE